MKCLILAGGFATRLWPFTEKRAKPLLPIAGKPLLSHTIEKIPDYLPIIISTNSAYADDFEKWKKNFPKRQIEIFIEDAESDDAKPGALAGVSLAIQKLKLNSNILLLAGDNYFGFSIQNFISNFRNGPLLAAYDIGSLEEARKFGVVVEKFGKVVEFQEKPDKPKSTLISAGCYVLPQFNLPEVVEYAKKHADNIGGLFEYFLQKGNEVRCWSFSDPWFDIGSFEAYISAHKFLLKQSQIITETAKLHDTDLSGAVVIGENALIKDSVIIDSVILDGVEIKNCVIKNSIIDNSCKLKGLDLDHKILRACTKIKI